MRFMILTQQEKINFIRDLFPRLNVADSCLIAEVSLFLEVEMYQPDDFLLEVKRILHVENPFPQRRILTDFDYVQLTLF